MKKHILKLLLLSILIIPLNTYAKSTNTFEGFAHRVESWAEGLSGYVVSSNGVTIDMGKNNNVVPGMEFTSSRDGETLTHPVTGKSLGRKKITTGKISISSVEQEYSVCKVLENYGIKKGDKVDHVFPVPVNLSTVLLNDEEKAKIKYELFKSSALVEDESSSYSVTCERKNSGANVARCSLNFKGKPIFYDDIEVKGIKIITAGKDSEKKGMKIDGSVRSIALGYFDTSKEYMAAVANSSTIILYSIKDNILRERSVLSSISGTIINIEALDLNKNGKDELFVSVLTKKQEPASYIFEYDGAAFQLIEKNIPYLFRSFFTEGKKQLICQNYREGVTVGMIYRVLYSKDSYKYDNPYDMSYGAGLYGYGETAEQNNIIFFNRHGLLNVAKNNNIKTYNDMEFGNTQSYIIYSEKIGTGVKVGQTAESGGFFVYDEKNVVVPVYQRIIQLEDGAFLLYTNTLIKNNMLGGYKQGALGAYFFTNDKAVVSWKTFVKGKAVNDIDILSDGSHIAYVVSNNKNGQDDAYLYIYK